MTLHKIFPDSVQGLSLEWPKVSPWLGKVRPCLPVRSRTQAGRSWPLLSSGGKPAKTCGFTLIEILIVIGIFLLLAALTLGIGVDTARRTTVASERTLYVELLEHARSRAMNNMGEMAHGIIVTPTDFVLFQGTAYSATNPSNEVSPRNNDITVSGPSDPATVVFAQLSGEVNVSQTGDIVFSNGAQTYTVGINSEGRIDW